MKTTGRVVLFAILGIIVVFAASCAPPSISKIAENTVDSLAKGDIASATKNFDATMKAAAPAEKLAQMWPALTKQVGDFKGRTGIREAKEQGFDTVYVTCQFAKMTFDFKFVFNKDKQISGLWLAPHKT